MTGGKEEQKGKGRATPQESEWTGETKEGGGEKKKGMGGGEGGGKNE